MRANVAPDAPQRGAIVEAGRDVGVAAAAVPAAVHRVADAASGVLTGGVLYKAKGLQRVHFESFRSHYRSEPGLLTCRSSAADVPRARDSCARGRIHVCDGGAPREAGYGR